MIKIGTRFGRLTVCERAENHFTSGGRRQGQWFCRCDCGCDTKVTSQNLRSGNTKSCGCLGREILAKRSKTHGFASRGHVSATYKIWNNMITRCTNPRRAQWGDYGGRGITVCERWRSFENFLADMGERPDGKSLDRRDANGNYDPENCSWATRTEQNRNTRRNRFVQYQGAEITVAALAETAGHPYWKVYQRLVRGWPVEQAIS